MTMSNSIATRLPMSGYRSGVTTRVAAAAAAADRVPDVVGVELPVVVGTTAAPDCVPCPAAVAKRGVAER